MSRSSGGRIRVLVVGQGPPTAGGIPTFVTSLVENELLLERFDVDFLNTTPQGTKRPGSLALSNFVLLARHAKEVFKRARSRDVVHLNLAPAPLLPLLRAIVLVLAGKLGRARVILHAHTGRMHIAAESRIYRLALRVVAHLANELIVVSQSALDSVRAVGGSATFLANGIEHDDIPTGPKDEPPLLTFVGTVCERKGVLDLRDALEGLRKDEELLLAVEIVGDAKQEGPGEFERMVEGYKSHGLDDVRFTGALDRSAVLETLGRSAIFCLPSHWEGFPLSLLEGMAAGCAVVATDVGDISEMLGNGDAGVVVPVKNPSRLSEAIRDLIQNPERRKELGNAARARVEGEYSQARLVKRLADLYERLGSHST